ncbi:HD domain-containing protein [Pseudodesulfovibrio sp. F-1]|uniref:HD domain-containing protein n=1 Tax=Pseudodesulfovibrio alkaliphilus TaxID=2661613 RepID=A0A7K1KPB3_9BACT|nr:HD domain-containing phosphohydrolase [Pseudodesulfovibrio alkaliphilus]MUM77929.1 HD domain-containing protein [Pseudodesulfovibrio alkaliphilus]
MSSFKRFIRPGTLRTLLRKAFELTGERCPLAIVLGGEVVLAEGASGLSEFDPSDPGVVRAPLRLDGEGEAELRLRLHAETAGRDEARRLLDFAAFTIQEFIDMGQARRSIADEALAKYRELALLHRLVPVINSSLRLRDVVGALMDECRRENYPGEMGMVFLCEPGSGRLRPAAQFGFSSAADLDGLAGCDLFSEVIRAGRGEIVNDLVGDCRWHGEMAGVESMLLIPLMSPNRCEGLLVLASAAPGAFEAAHGKSLSTLASVTGISVSNAFNFEGVQTLMNAILKALAEAIDSRDPFTAGHSERVAHLAVAFAFLLGEGGACGVRFNDQELREIYYAGILHDVGKIGIREDVLTKDSRLPKRRMQVIRARFRQHGLTSDFDWADAYERVRALNTAMTPAPEELDHIRRLGAMRWGAGGEQFPLLYDDELDALLLEYGNLTHDERLEIQRHPAESERILQHIPLHEGYANMLAIIRQHHERMDGSGYPDGLRGDEILVQSRIMAIVDIYDAVTQERHYKPASTRSEAIRVLAGEAEQGKLDRDLVTFFRAQVTRIEALSVRVRFARVTHLSEIGRFATL